MTNWKLTNSLLSEMTTNKKESFHSWYLRSVIFDSNPLCICVNVNSPLQIKSFFCTSGTLRPLMLAGAMHWVKGAKPRRALSQSESQDRWQSQWRLLECRRLRGENTCCLNNVFLFKRTTDGNFIFLEKYESAFISRMVLFICFEYYWIIFDLFCNKVS